VGPFLIIGFLGGFTTFSTFAYDSMALLQEGKSLLAFGNILLSVFPGLLAVWLGLRLATA
jgi:CrcB protein